MSRIHIGAASVPLLCAMDRHIRTCDLRGQISRFVDAAADPLDGAATRGELADLIKRRLLTVVDYGYDDSRGRDPMRDMDGRLCGSGWSVNPTERLLRALWSDRITN